MPDEPSGRDPVTLALFVAVAAALIAALSLLGYLLYSTLGGAPKSPRTLAELRIQTLQGTTRQNPKDVKAWTVLVSVYSGAGKYDEAHRTLRDARAALGSDPSSLGVEEGRLLFFEEKKDEAIRVLQKTVQKAQAERQARIAELKKSDVVEKVPSQSLNDAQCLLGDIYARMAAEHYGRAVALDRSAKSAAAKLQLARQLAATGATATPSTAAPAAAASATATPATAAAAATVPVTSSVTR
jgi:tetratricopeptide (TPR) repeat protein